MQDKKDSNPKDRAATTRLDLSLFPATARAYGAWAMTEGDLKYGGYNYRVVGVKASVYYSACGRHLDKWFNGEECDLDSGVPHLASALACLAVLIDAKECHKLTDDRPPPTTLDALLSGIESGVKKLQELYPNGAPRCTSSLDLPPESTPIKSTPPLYRRIGPFCRRRINSCSGEVRRNGAYPWGRRKTDVIPYTSLPRRPKHGK